MRSTRAAPRGFTLVELMVVVAIIGLLASIAIPEFQRFTYLSKLAEADLIISKMDEGIRARFGERNKFPDSSGSGSQLYASWNPAWPPSPGKRPWQPNRPGWNQVLEQPTGEVFLTYFAQGAFDESNNTGFFYVYANADLDGDGLLAQRLRFYRYMNGEWTHDPVLEESYNTPRGIW